MKPDHLNTEREGLCTSLNWKSKFIWAKPDPTVPPSNSGLFWCGITQTCVGPDGQLAEPMNCCSANRHCHCDSEKAG